MISLKNAILPILFILILPISVWSTPLDGVSEGYSGVFQLDGDSSQEIPFELYQYEEQYILRMNNRFYHLGIYGGELVYDSYNFGFSNGLYQYYGVFDVPPKVKAVVVDVFNGGVREYMMQLEFDESQKMVIERFVLATQLPDKSPEYSDNVVGYYLKDSSTEYFNPSYDADGNITNLSERGEPIWKKTLTNLQNDCFTSGPVGMIRIGNCAYFVPTSIKSVQEIPVEIVDFARDSLLKGIKETEEKSNSNEKETDAPSTTVKSINEPADSSINKVEDTASSATTEVKEQIGAAVQISNPTEKGVIVKEKIIEEKLVYVVESSQEGRLFGLFEVSVPIKREVSALGVSQKEEKPWWSIFVFT